MEMGRLNKFFFWFFLIILAFMPYGIVMTFAILLLYYGVPYIKSELYEVYNESKESQPSQNESMNEYSEDTLDKMR